MRRKERLLKMTMNLRVRRANVADVPAMMHLERQSAAAAHWSQQQYEGWFDPTNNPQWSERVAWVVEDECEAQPEKFSSEAPQILAFLVVHRVDAEWELENIVVTGTLRRRGVGTRLLGEFIAHARATDGSGIFLEVRESNQSARALYRKAVFEETGLRKSYYSNPPEDAILCRLSLY
jgi:ribosomal-protein-alanine N-acetyltransferase